MGWFRPAAFAICALAALGTAAAVPASAATLTFDAAPDEGAAYWSDDRGLSYSEGGFTARTTSGILAYRTTPGALYLADFGTPFANDLTFTGEGLFDAASFSIISGGYTAGGQKFGKKLSNIIVTGFLDGVAVATQGYRMKKRAGALQNFVLGAGFAGIDALTISLVNVFDPTRCGAPCTRLRLDSIVLNPRFVPALAATPAQAAEVTEVAEISPVPLPAPGLLLAGAALGLLAFRRRVTARA